MLRCYWTFECSWRSSSWSVCQRKGHLSVERRGVQAQAHWPRIITLSLLLRKEIACCAVSNPHTASEQTTSVWPASCTCAQENAFPAIIERDLACSNHTCMR